MRAVLLLSSVRRGMLVETRAPLSLREEQQMSMSKHVVVGAGPVGLATARELVAQGHEEVLLVSRSGAGAEIDGVRRVALDASDADALATLAQGASALYNCINPPSYDVWPTWWPPIAAALLAAAESLGSGARHGVVPLRLRAGRRPDGRGDARCRARRQGSAARRHVGRRPCGPRGRTDPCGRGPRLRLPRAGRDPGARAGGGAERARRQDRPPLRGRRRAPHLHRRARHGPRPGRRRHDAVGARPCLARRRATPRSRRRRRSPTCARQRVGSRGR